jgi:uncharacterized protein YndB with AHSA1/START domain
MTDTRTPLDPVVKQAIVNCDPERAFATYTRGISGWWPLASHSVGDHASRVVIEERAGGRMYEVEADGSEHPWGTVTAWEPPHRLVIAWHVNPDAPAATEIELTFTAVGDGRTEVRLEHRGWEVLADPAASRDGYDDGWGTVFGAYVAALS